MTLPLTDVAAVTMLVSPSAPTARGFGTNFLLGSNSLPLEERMRFYASLSDVAVDHLTSSEEYKGATAHFAQIPAPPPILIGNRFTTAQAGRLRGGTVSSTLSAYTGITNGGFDIVINGTNRQIFALDFSGAASLAAVATLIQTKLNAALSGTTCTWSATLNRFTITSPTTGTSSTVGYAVAPTGGSSPTDVSATLGFTFATGALSVNGIAIESMTDSLNASQIFNGTFYSVQLTGTASTQDVKDAMAWAEGAKVLFWYSTADTNAPISSATSDLGYYASNLGYNRTVSMSDLANSTLYLSLSGAARLASVDYDQPNSITTLKFKQAPGFAPAPLTSTQAANLKAKHYNYYVSRGDIGGTPFSMFEEGVVANGRFIDEVIGLDWLQATLRTALFAALATSPTGIPNTDAGAGMLVQAATGALNKAVTNGLLAPGNWRGPNVGEVKTGQFLPAGFYIFAGRVADQSTTDRDLRKSPPLTAIGIGAGAIHSVALTFTFQR